MSIIMWKQKINVSILAAIIIPYAISGCVIGKKSNAPSLPGKTKSSALPSESAKTPKQAPKPITAEDKKHSQADEEENSSPIETKIKFGSSVNGQPLDAYIMGHGTDVTIIFGVFHGNEPSTDGVVYLLHDYLRDNPKLLDGKTVVLVPKVNPDGLKRNTRTNAHGVDINRNFPGTWRKQIAKARYNPGPRAASEPETRAVIALMEKYKPTKVISIHEPFHTMNYTGKPGKQLALEMRKFNHYPITADIGYPTPGSFGDYCGKTLGIAIVTLELPNQSADAAWHSNKQALLAAISH